MAQARSLIQSPVTLSGGLLVALFVAAFAVASGDPGTFSTIIMSGLFQGMLLFLVASGLSIIFGLMDVLNFAQGVYFMIGAYVAYDFHHRELIMGVVPNSDARFILAVVIATLVGAILGVILERGLLRPLYARPIFQIVLTFGVGIVLTEVVKFIWSTTPYSWTEPFSVRELSFTLGEQSFSGYRLFVILIGFIMIVAVALLLRFTRIGIIIRAGVEDSEMVEALGINVRAVFTLVFTMGCALAAFGGAIAAPFFGATPSLGTNYLLGAIAIVALGGLDSYEGAAVASIIVGVGVAIMQQFTLISSLVAPVWASLTPMLLLTAVLLVRPRGLFGTKVE
ncbi:MAG: branched-chain amino acid ABC transporter permease [Chloroflexota bacterium]